MKKLFSIALVAIFAFAMNAKAQNHLVATLNHEGTVTAFYGFEAFVKAHKAATHGDVVTLSSGKFKSTNITKAITIQGAGIIIKTDSVSPVLPTVLQEDYQINIADSITQRLKIEGIYHQGVVNVINLKSPQFSKCFFRRISANVTPFKQFMDATFIQCHANSIYLSETSSATFYNSVICGATQQNNISGGFVFVNCYLTNDTKSSSKIYNNHSSEYRNCIIYYPASPSSDGNIGWSSSNYFHNLLITDNGMGKLPIDRGNVTIKSDAAPNLAIEYSDANTYELTEEQKALYKGTDGTEVGIYGGQFPYDPIPNTPQITKFKVANKSTADGKLKVEIEVKGVE